MPNIVQSWFVWQLGVIPVADEGGGYCNLSVCCCSTITISNQYWPLYVFMDTSPPAALLHQVRAGNGELRERAVTQLSGGERKRVALALALGYTQLASSRGRLSSNLLILDEVRLGAVGCDVQYSLEYPEVVVMRGGHAVYVGVHTHSLTSLLHL
jgi:ABC-type cobalamin transport system ATPase subunit